jgi:hypothetical protein
VEVGRAREGARSAAEREPSSIAGRTERDVTNERIADEYRRSTPRSRERHGRAAAVMPGGGTRGVFLAPRGMGDLSTPVEPPEVERFLDALDASLADREE